MLIVQFSLPDILAPHMLPDCLPRRLPLQSLIDRQHSLDSRTPGDIGLFLAPSAPTRCFLPLSLPLQVQLYNECWVGSFAEAQSALQSLYPSSTAFILPGARVAMSAFSSPVKFSVIVSSSIAIPLYGTRALIPTLTLHPEVWRHPIHHLPGDEFAIAPQS
ncbi:hypothetical protein K469DRAFT_234053 [Zopfia rhizophila CBS 207.26]|uniref:Uncharacterized protein n=1 Tax=Zopfia rhizophila CBS 207.26 TaxID=1314779 RepID=A0A6A6EQL6_9PEZI|nr:hypothetical protein K469DRAFT_234053 [Zopfia rhizophila CBS 207.26]